jgi:hypothetical protein
MARNHSKPLADAQAAGFTDDEQDVLDSELDVDLDAEKTDDEDSQGALQKTTQRAISVKRKHKSTKFVQDDTREYQSACFRISCQIMMVQLLRNHLQSSLTS